MEFRKVEESGSNMESVSWNHNDMPEIEGTIVNYKENVGMYSKSLWNIKTPENQVYTIWSSTQLVKKLAQCPVGSYIKVVFLGKKPKKKGAGHYNDFDVFIAEDSAPPTQPQPARQPQQQTPQTQQSTWQQPTNEPESFGEEVDDVPF